MKKLLLLLTAILLTQNIATSQIYGNVLHDVDGQMNINYYTWWRVLTGPSDSGNFTHLGIYINAINTANSVEIAIYDHDINTELPQNLLTDVHLEPLISDAFNEIALPNTIALNPNTYYWIGLRSEEHVGIRGLSGGHWPYTTYWYPSVYSQPWINPAPTSMNGSNQTGLGVVYIVANNMTLPIELKSIHAKQKREYITIDWETSSETNNAGWNIQRTNDGISYNNIGWVKGKENSDDLKAYTFNDLDPKRGLNIYRLQQIDLDGRESYSKHITVNFKSNNITVYPNPAKDFITIDGLEMGTVKIINSFGQIEMEVTIYKPKTINISNLKNGVYSLIFNHNCSEKALSFIKID